MQNAATLRSFPAVSRPASRPLPQAPAADAPRLATHCCNCSLRELCLPCGMGAQGSAHVEELSFGRRRIKRGEHAYRAGDGFASLYAIRSGCFRSSLLHEDGREQVIGFFIAGDVMGMDGIGEGRQACDAVALEDSEVCVIPFAQLERMSCKIPALQQQFHRMMGREIVRDHGIMLLLGSMSAEERVAAFLLNLSKRYAARGYSAAHFNLRMTREDIGSYLGLKLETVSRAFSRFHDEGMIAVHNKSIEIRDCDRLQAVIGGNDQRRPPRVAQRANGVALAA